MTQMNINTTIYENALRNKYIYINTYEGYMSFLNTINNFRHESVTKIPRNKFKIGFYRCNSGQFAFAVKNANYDIIQLEDIIECLRYTSWDAPSGTKLFKIIFGSKTTIENKLNDFVTNNTNIEIIDYKMSVGTNGDYCCTIFYIIN